MSSKSIYSLIFFKEIHFFSKKYKYNYTTHRKHIKNPNSQSNFKNKKIQGWKIWFQNLLPIYSNQNTLVFTWKQIHRPINRIESSEINPHLHSQVIFIFNLFNWRIITLQYCGGFWHTLTRISHGCTYVPIPLGCPSALALSALFLTSNLDWSSISHMVIHMFQCYSLRSSHPWFFPQGPKVVLYICVSFAISHIGSSLPSF